MDLFGETKNWETELQPILKNTKAKNILWIIKIPINFW